MTYKLQLERNFARHYKKLAPNERDMVDAKLRTLARTDVSAKKAPRSSVLTSSAEMHSAAASATLSMMIESAIARTFLFFGFDTHRISKGSLPVSSAGS